MCDRSGFFVIQILVNTVWRDHVKLDMNVTSTNAKLKLIRTALNDECVSTFRLIHRIIEDNEVNF